MSEQPSSKELLQKAARLMNQCWEAAIGASSQPEFQPEDAEALAVALDVLLRESRSGVYSPDETTTAPALPPCEHFWVTQGAQHCAYCGKPAIEWTDWRLAQKASEPTTWYCQCGTANTAGRCTNCNRTIDEG